jgi:hypothetical protein
MKAFDLFKFKIEDNFRGLHTVDVFARDYKVASTIAVNVCIKELDKKPCAIWFKILGWSCIKGSDHVVGREQIPDRNQEEVRPSQNPRSDTESSKICYLKPRLLITNPE